MKWVYSGSTTFTPASENLIKKYDYVYSSSTEGMAWKDLMTKYDGQTVTYDAIGNPTSYMGATMYWEGRTLVEHIKDGTTITYSYDSSDMRTSKTVGGVKHNYYYVEGKLMYEDCPSYKLFYSYDANGFLSGIKRVKSNGVTENFGVHCNIFGDVISIYFSDGSLAATYTYDTWGKLLAVTDMTGNDVMGDNEIWTQNSIRYRGYVYDEETQLYYLQSRYYDPEICRFINADDYSVLTTTPTALTDKNLFAYCNDNPIFFADDEGESVVVAAAIGGAIGAVTNTALFVIDGLMRGNTPTGKQIAVKLAFGALNGILTPITITNPVLSMTLSGVLGAAEEGLTQWAGNKDIDYGEIVISGVTNMLFDSISISSSLKSMNVDNYISSQKSIYNKAVNVSKKPKTNAKSYYNKMTGTIFRNQYKKTAYASSINNLGSNTLTCVASTGFNKLYQKYWSK